MNKNLFFCFLAIFFVVVYSQTTTDITKTHICDPNDADGIEIGKNATLCIHFEEFETKVAFTVEVDKYSVISALGGFNLAYQYSKEKTSNVSLVAQMGENVTVFPSPFYTIKQETTPNSLFSLFNIVIKVEEGRIYDIVWDNGCFDCSGTDFCETIEVKNLTDATSVLQYQNCKVDASTIESDESTNNFQYDPKFYVTWFGTDKKKRQMKSSNLAMSKFKKYSISSLYNSAKNAFDDAYEGFKKQWDEIKKKTDEIIGKNKTE